jgi:hypothetical protein
MATAERLLCAFSRREPLLDAIHHLPRRALLVLVSRLLCYKSAVAFTVDR